MLTPKGLTAELYGLSTVFYCCCDGNQSHAVTFFTSRSNQYAGWESDSVVPPGAFTSLPDHGPGPIRVFCEGWGGSVQEEALFSTHSHTSPGRVGFRENVFSHQAAPDCFIPTIALSYLHTIRRRDALTREHGRRFSLQTMTASLLVRSRSTFNSFGFQILPSYECNFVVASRRAHM